MRRIVTTLLVLLALVAAAGPGLSNCTCEDWKNTDNYNLTLGQTYMDPDGRIAITVHEAIEVEVTNQFIARDLQEHGQKALAFLVTIRNATGYVIDVSYPHFWVEDEFGHKFPAERVAIDGQFDGDRIRPGTQRRGYVTVPVPEHLSVTELVFVYDMGASPNDYSYPVIRNSEYAVYRLTQD